YTVTATNNGPDDAANVKIVDPLPAGVVFQGASAGCTNNAGTVTCQLGTLAAKATATRQIVVLVATNRTLPVVNIGTVSADTTDSDASNNQASRTTTVTPACSSPPRTGTIAGTLIVASGQFVCLDHANVTAGVSVRAGGAFTASASQINGPIDASGAVFVTLCGSSVSGPVAFDSTALMVRVGDDDIACAGNTIGSLSL